jgi:aminoglycoside phosphotransferase (APT) family kinase protein
MASSDFPDLRGAKLVGDGLRVEALVGYGGAAAVYRVRDEATGRKLALKQLRPPGDERRALVASQFEREYHTLCQLAHPRIIEVFDYGFVHGSAYYTMELLDGEDLYEFGREFSPLLICGEHQGERMIAGAAALCFADDERPEPRQAMLEAVMGALIAQDIVDPITTHVA